jgi:hypothetical protein
MYTQKALSKELSFLPDSSPLIIARSVPDNLAGQGEIYQKLSASERGSKGISMATLLLQWSNNLFLTKMKLRDSG